jgi:hypothetical protein
MGAAPHELHRTRRLGAICKPRRAAAHRLIFSDQRPLLLGVDNVIVPSIRAMSSLLHPGPRGWNVHPIALGRLGWMGAAPWRRRSVQPPLQPNCETA